MGQAKQRGSKDQRVAEAIERNANNLSARKFAITTPRRSNRAVAKAMMAIALSQVFVAGTKP